MQVSLAHAPGTAYTTFLCVFTCLALLVMVSLRVKGSQASLCMNNSYSHSLVITLHCCGALGVISESLTAVPGRRHHEQPWLWDHAATWPILMAGQAALARGDHRISADELTSFLDSECVAHHLLHTGGGGPFHHALSCIIPAQSCTVPNLPLNVDLYAVTCQLMTERPHDPTS